MREATAAVPQDNGSLAGEIGNTTAGREGAQRKTPSKHQRLVSLDIVRGLTMFVMVFVDEVGDAYPAINHSPWNNVTFADFVSHVLTELCRWPPLVWKSSLSCLTSLHRYNPCFRFPR